MTHRSSHSGFLAAVAWLALISTGCSDPLDNIYARGIEAYSRGAYEEAEPWVRQAAERDHVDGQAILGVMYLHGRGVPFDGTQAEYWLRKSAEAGKVDAQSILGMMYATGYGVAPDRDKGYRWLTKAAEAGDKQAKEMLPLYVPSDGGTP